MKLQELIEKLHKLQEQYGSDVEVCIPSQDGGAPDGTIDEVEYFHGNEYYNKCVFIN